MRKHLVETVGGLPAPRRQHRLRKLRFRQSLATPLALYVVLAEQLTAESARGENDATFIERVNSKGA